ncbi:VOC family protein [Streptomyces albipurpureus]|uniref:VOC family protein n=1 Tax=Streptomyces albipurpureus TaxID=2897419 RepID=A0ABT0UUW5_9ACTN|nr:VOC family protein [Streptomyces sp. CWNU-1]MCM2392249.1 VOC family protein [Streptomyces sp. CWNU-1]
MPARLDHTIVHVNDRFAGARFLADLLGGPQPKENGPFAALTLDGGVTLDYLDQRQGPHPSQHLAFLVSEDEFDDIYAKIVARQIPHWADPTQQTAGETYRLFGGRGVYVEDPDGHLLEFLTYVVE